MNWVAPTMTGLRQVPNGDYGPACSFCNDHGEAAWGVCVCSAGAALFSALMCTGVDERTEDHQ